MYYGEEWKLVWGKKRVPMRTQRMAAHHIGDQKKRYESFPYIQLSIYMHHSTPLPAIASYIFILYRGVS